MSTKKHLFTLVELLGVMGLIAVLAALGFSGYSYAMTTAKDKSTRATIKRLEAGLDAMRSKQGYYPSSGTAFEKIKITLNSDNTIKKVTLGSTTYTVKTTSSSSSSLTNAEKAINAFLAVVEPDTLINSRDSSNYLVDAWGNPIYYRYPAKIHTGGFDLISAGPDGKFGEDNASEPVEKMEKYRDRKDGSPLCDDVMND